MRFLKIIAVILTMPASATALAQYHAGYTAPIFYRSTFEDYRRMPDEQHDPSQAWRAMNDAIGGRPGHEHGGIHADHSGHAEHKKHNEHEAAKQSDSRRNHAGRKDRKQGRGHAQSKDHKNHPGHQDRPQLADYMRHVAHPAGAADHSHHHLYLNH